MGGRSGPTTRTRRVRCLDRAGIATSVAVSPDHRHETDRRSRGHGFGSSDTSVGATGRSDDHGHRRRPIRVDLHADGEDEKDAADREDHQRQDVEQYPPFLSWAHPIVAVDSTKHR